MKPKLAKSEMAANQRKRIEHRKYQCVSGIALARGIGEET
jgi:hypothetical protein